MQLSYLLLSILPFVVYAELNGPCTGDKATGEYGTKGTCIATADCTSAGGHYKNDACPSDPVDIKCCVIDSTPEAPEEPETPAEPDTPEPDTPEPDTPEPDTPELETPEPETPEEPTPAPEAPEPPPAQTGAGMAITNPVAALVLGIAALAL